MSLLKTKKGKFKSGFTKNSTTAKKNLWKRVVQTVFVKLFPQDETEIKLKETNTLNPLKFLIHFFHTPRRQRHLLSFLWSKLNFFVTSQNPQKMSVVINFRGFISWIDFTCTILNININKYIHMVEIKLLKSEK